MVYEQDVRIGEVDAHSLILLFYIFYTCFETENYNRKLQVVSGLYPLFSLSFDEIVSFVNINN